MRSRMRRVRDEDEEMKLARERWDEMRLGREKGGVVWCGAGRGWLKWGTAKSFISGASLPVGEALVGPGGF